MNRSGETWELSVLPGGKCIVVLLGPVFVDGRGRELPIALTIWSEAEWLEIGDVGPWDPVYFTRRHDTRRIA